MSDLRLEHVNIPARDPVALASWYAATFGLQANKHVARGPGVIFAFVPAEPLGRKSDDFHIGLRVPSLEALNRWAQKFNVTPVVGPEFTAFRIPDPEGNSVELYTPSA